jgi:predicted RNase H-like HicB family nuclease
MTEKKDYKIIVKKDGKFYAGYYLEIPQARGQGDTKSQAIEDTKKAIKIYRSYLNKKITSSNVITVSVRAFL